MRPRQIYNVIPGVKIRIDGEYCHPKCYYFDLNVIWCLLFRTTSGQLIQKLEDGDKDIRCLRCKIYTSKQDNKEC